MKKKINNPFVKSLCFFLFIIPGYIGNTQCVIQLGDDANNYDKPFMWAKNDQTLIDNFKNIKWPLLNNSNLGQGQPSSFRLGNFLGMLQYFEKKYGKKFQCLHVYIAARTKEGTSHVPTNGGNKLTLIFAPAIANTNPPIKTDIDYFSIPPDEPFDETKLDRFKINDVQQEWRDNYQQNALHYLDGTIDDIDNNHDDAGKKSDTKCITYCEDALCELIKEQMYRHFDISTKEPFTFTTDMEASFAAFGDSGNPRNSGNDKKRLFVQFDFIDSRNNQPFLLENTDGFLLNRSDTKKTFCKNCLYNKNGKMFATDNGQLCPPSQNCPPN